MGELLAALFQPIVAFFGAIAALVINLAIAVLTAILSVFGISTDNPHVNSVLTGVIAALVSYLALGYILMKTRNIGPDGLSLFYGTWVVIGVILVLALALVCRLSSFRTGPQVAGVSARVDRVIDKVYLSYFVSALTLLGILLFFGARNDMLTEWKADQELVSKCAAAVERQSAQGNEGVKNFVISKLSKKRDEALIAKCKDRNIL